MRELVIDKKDLDKVVKMLEELKELGIEKDVLWAELMADMERI